ncbi:cytochrome P450 [Chiua virens]|nr:cytochrome P450 [Chiua virens]
MSQWMELATQLPSTFVSLASIKYNLQPLRMFDSGWSTRMPTAAWTTAVAVAVVFAYLFKRVRTGRRLLEGVPEPAGHSLLWGHQRIVAEKSVGTAFAAWMEELHARVIKIRGALFNPDVLVVGDPLAATHIMQKYIYDYPHSQVVRSRIARMLGKSLGWVEGESEHKRMRALVASSLGSEALRAGTPDVYIAAEKLADNLKTHVLEYNERCEISIVDWINQATLEAIGRLGFGHDFEGGRSSDAQKILGAWRTMACMAISTTGFYALVMLRRFPVLNYLPLKALRVQMHVRNTIHRGVARELLRRNQVAEQDLQGKRFTKSTEYMTFLHHLYHPLIVFLASAHSSGSITTEELMDHISMFIMAGSETTAQSLAYAIWELARHPDIQSRLREETMTYPGSPSYDALQTQLPYLDAVPAKCNLRLHPGFPYMERVAAKDDILPLRHPIIGKEGYELTSIPISAGQTVIIPIHTINRMDSVWSDGTNFRPERWMEELPQKDLCSTGWSRMLTFSDGPRNCIGFRFALLQFKIILLTLVKHFDFDDTGATIVSKVASSTQPVVAGEEHRGPRLPVNVSLL